MKTTVVNVAITKSVVDLVSFHDAYLSDSDMSCRPARHDHPELTKRTCGSQARVARIIGSARLSHPAFTKLQDRVFAKSGVAPVSSRRRRALIMLSNGKKIVSLPLTAARHKLLSAVLKSSG